MKFAKRAHDEYLFKWLLAFVDYSMLLGYKNKYFITKIIIKYSVLNTSKISAIEF